MSGGAGWLALGIGLLTISGVAAQTISFSAEPIESLPSTFQAALTGQGMKGVWGVVNDESAPGGKALEQRTPDPTDYRFPLAIYQPTVLRNLQVSVRFKSMYGKVDRAGGLAVRVIDPDNYYVVRANALEDNVNFYRVVAGRRQEIKGANTKVTSGEWHVLGLRAEGDKFTVTFDGRDLFAATDRTFGGEGRVALWTKADSVTRFNDLKVKALDAAQ